MQLPDSQMPVLHPDLYARYLEYLQVSERSAATYIRALRQLRMWLQSEGISSPTRADLISWRRSLILRGLKATTVQSYITSAKLFFRWLTDEGLYPDISRGLKGGNVDVDFKRDYLTAPQIQDVIFSIDATVPAGLRDAAMIALMATCGLRTIEVSRADVSDLRPLAGKTALYLHGKGRSDKNEFVIVPPQVESLLRRYLSSRNHHPDAPLFTSMSNNNCGARLTTRSVSAIVKDRLIRAGFDSDRLTAHSLRHSMVTLALLSGQEIADVCESARHRSISSTYRYAHILKREKNTCSASVAEQLFPDD